MSEHNRSGMVESVFPPAADASRYYPAAASEQCRKRIARAIFRDEGPSLLIGSSGTGKTMLLDVVRHQFHDSCDVAPLVGSQIGGRADLLRTILFRLGVPYKGLEEGELRLALVDRLQREKPSASKLLLLVDEAELLGPEVFEELRALSSLVRGGEPMVALVLAGGAELEEIVAEPRLKALNQRVSARNYLTPLGHDEMLRYVAAHIEAVGIEPKDLFTDEAMEAVWQSTAGLPRLVNQLCDQVVWDAAESESAPADAAAVERAWCELQQIPSTGAVAESSSVGGDVVEFGELSADAATAEVCFTAVEQEDGDLESTDDDTPASIPFARGGAASEPRLEDLVVAAGEAPLPAPEEPARPPLAEDPFREAFDEEIAVEAPYCGAGVLKSAYDHFPMLEMGRRSSTVAARHPLATDRGEQDVLVIDDAETGVARVVPGRQFRTLFSELESGRRLPRSG
ncbi:MAG: AAA family ATPase [Planctomycetota bacterium]